jgi:sporulation protein YtfJ
MKGSFIMKEQTTSGLLATAIEKIRDLVDVSTIIGDPIQVGDGVSIIPVSKVTYGFASGGSDFPSKTNTDLFGGGGGAGVTINPVAFLVINNGEVTIKHITSGDNSAERIIGMVPEVVDKVSNIINKFVKEKPAEDSKSDKTE